ncbi:MAG: methyltransferase domain-containing protein [Candidatus Binatus sp.]|uniref:methyltransferase domain-containing protein n=1 Tax=Candidatus Binatus sp. TaxID=2811406 RepID=UPI00271DD82B|nr:methyltransferase domain-containing protein [Candidatus Binatus sp.]MDO8433596.1 methyltransferase domain-containing protein [Candidatus Binatus sp.]
MADWNPELYNRFRRYRAEPVEHIFSRLQFADDEQMIDLGCGPGDNTVELARRSAHGAARGVDSSPAMIEAAEKLRDSLPIDLKSRLSFAVIDVSTFSADREYSLIFSNATIQWLRDHRGVFTRCLAALKPGGRLAVQMPANAIETAKVEMDRLLGESPWRELLGGIQIPFRKDAVPEHYLRMLTELGYADVDSYYVTFHHPMDSPAEVVQWYRSTGLRPFVDALPDDRQGEFLAAYTERLERAYGATGPMTFDFRRIFIWGRRPG